MVTVDKKVQVKHKRLAKSQRIHVRRMKAAARKAAVAGA